MSFSSVSVIANSLRLRAVKFVEISIRGATRGHLKKGKFMYAKGAAEGGFGLRRGLKPPLGHPLIVVPGVIAREIDVLPAKRRDVL